MQREQLATGDRGGASTEPDDVRAIIDALRELTTAVDRYIDSRGSARGLHRTDLHALGHVMDAARADLPLTPTSLAAALGLSAPATSALLTRLESAGHVRRTHSAPDRRRVSIDMTDAAMGVGREVFGPLAQAIRGVLAEYDGTEREVILRFLLDAAAASAQARDA